MNNQKLNVLKWLIPLSILLVCSGGVWFGYLKPAWESLKANYDERAKRMPPIMKGAKEIDRWGTGLYSNAWEVYTSTLKVDMPRAAVQDYYQSQMPLYCKEALTWEDDGSKLKTHCYTEPCLDLGGNWETFEVQLEAISETQTSIIIEYNTFPNPCWPFGTPTPQPASHNTIYLSGNSNQLSSPSILLAI